MQKLPRKFRVTNENGQAMVEFALVAPMLALLVFAILQFGIAFNNYLTLTDAVRAGARTAAVSRRETDPKGVTASKVRASAVNLEPSKLQVSVSPSTTPWKAGDDATVTATYPYEISLMGIAVKSGNLTSTSVERIE